MRIASKVLVFFCFPFNILGYQMYFAPDIDIYNDLVAMNTTCFPDDMCLEAREEDSPGIPLGRRCSCHAQCAVYDTCCYNSPHRGYSHPLMECTSIRGSGEYFLVGKCPPDELDDSVWKSLCEDPWNGEDDIMKIAPVTSLDTRTVYKNIYCLRCHERSDNFHQWYLHTEGLTPDETADSKNYTVSFDQVNRLWIAVSDDKSASLRVDLYFSSAPERGSVEYVHSCRKDVISDCHDSWTDDYVRDKCRGYNSLRYALKAYGYDEYKNPHCAICNYVAPEKITCTRSKIIVDRPPVSPPIRPPPVSPPIKPIPMRPPPIRPPVSPPVSPPIRPSVRAGGLRGGGDISFPCLIGGMFSDEDNKCEKLQNKCSENHLWDPYWKRCRKIRCALPGFEIRSGRCTPL